MTGNSGLSVAALSIAGSTLDLLNVLGESMLSRTLGKVTDRLTRDAIRISSQADAEARVRATANLISAQRAALGGSGIIGGRTARLLEARARINAGREQLQADQSRVFAETRSRLERIQSATASRLAVFGAAGALGLDLFSLRNIPSLPKKSR